jgi:hypothetical protein
MTKEAQIAVGLLAGWQRRAAPLAPVPILHIPTHDSRAANNRRAMRAVTRCARRIIIEEGERQRSKAERHNDGGESRGVGGALWVPMKSGDAERLRSEPPRLPSEGPC